MRSDVRAVPAARNRSRRDAGLRGSADGGQLAGGDRLGPAVRVRPADTGGLEELFLSLTAAGPEEALIS